MVNCVFFIKYLLEKNNIISKYIVSWSYHSDAAFPWRRHNKGEAKEDLGLLGGFEGRVKVILEKRNRKERVLKQWFTASVDPPAGGLAASGCR